jgi:DTW domain-containing protein YfiP
MKTDRVRVARPTCYRCLRPQVACYCDGLKPVESHPRIVILMHPLEARHPIATGRLAHRALSNSRLFIGSEFGPESEAARLARDPGHLPLLLFPGPESLALESSANALREESRASGRELMLFVLDATWSLARKMLHRSPALQGIRRVSFSSGERSRFLVRRQPAPECLSSIEAIDRVLRLFGTGAGPGTMAGAMGIFDRMVAFQLSAK